MTTAILKVSEYFYSIQGEGPSAGTPSVFLRLKGCNLTCGGNRTVQTGKLDSGATWRCDTIEVWTQGKDWKFEDLIHEWRSLGYLDAFARGAHLVITGGEPLLHDTELVSFLTYLASIVPDMPYIEMETNGTIHPSPSLDHFVSQYNVSPKLANSGMASDKRVVAPTLNWFNTSSKSCFKFVICEDDDLEECLSTFITPFSLDSTRIWLMPGCEDRDGFVRVGPLVAQLAMDYGFQFSPRLQLMLWDRKTGV